MTGEMRSDVSPTTDSMMADVSHSNNKHLLPDNMTIDCNKFNSRLYTQRLMQNASLSQLLTHESQICKEVSKIDSDMQTLVYENYNKFITATETIRQMRVDFRSMEDEMDQLAGKMANITTFAGELSTNLRPNRQALWRLSSTHDQLQRLQFIFDLPVKLKQYNDGGVGGDTDNDLLIRNWEKGVRYYVRAKHILNQYQHMTSFKGIKSDCDALIKELREKIHKKLMLREQQNSDECEENEDGGISVLDEDKSRHVECAALCVKLLIWSNDDSLNDVNSIEKHDDIISSTKPPWFTESILFSNYFEKCQILLNQTLIRLQDEIKKVRGGVKSAANNNQVSFAMDILEFIDVVANSFISDLCLIITIFQNMLEECHRPPPSSSSSNADSHQVVKKSSNGFKFVSDFMEINLDALFSIVSERFECCSLNPLDDMILITSGLDRLNRRLQAMSRLLNKPEVEERAIQLVVSVARCQSQQALSALELELESIINDCRKSLLAFPESESSSSSSLNNQFLLKISRDLNQKIVDHLKRRIDQLHMFMNGDLSFSCKVHFRSRFGKTCVREGLVLAFFGNSIGKRLLPFRHSTYERLSPVVLLVLAHAIHSLSSSSSFSTPDTRDSKRGGADICIVSKILDDIDERFYIHFNNSHVIQSPIDDCVNAEEVKKRMTDISNQLLCQYVKVQAGVVSHTVHRCVVSQTIRPLDFSYWLDGCVAPPTSVRSVMRRIVEQIKAIDHQTSQLFREGDLGHGGAKSAGGKSSDSGRLNRVNVTAKSNRSSKSYLEVGGLHHPFRTSSSSVSNIITSKQKQHHKRSSAFKLDMSLASNIQKMFNERIEIFNKNIQWNGASITTAVVKIVLKTLWECSREQTFSKFGFQQFQVDCKYLQTYLWPYVTDENILVYFFDEISSSVVHRCDDPDFLDPQTIESIIESTSHH